MTNKHPLVPAQGLQNGEYSYSKNEIELIKDTVCRGASDEELKVFLHACSHTKLDPLMKQIYSIPRWDSNLRREARTVQVSIDGLRLIAERTGRYMPGPKATFTYDENGKLVAATAYVKRQDSQGKWHVIEADALYEEYVQTKKDGSPASLWGTKPHIMLAKCAESLALRRAFPAEMSPVRSHEEMGVIDVEAAMPETLRDDHLEELEQILQLIPDVLPRILAAYSVGHLRDLKVRDFDKIKTRLQQLLEEKRAMSPFSPADAESDPEN